MNFGWCCFLGGLFCVLLSTFLLSVIRFTFVMQSVHCQSRVYCQSICSANLTVMCVAFFPSHVCCSQSLGANRIRSLYFMSVNSGVKLKNLLTTIYNWSFPLNQYNFLDFIVPEKIFGIPWKSKFPLSCSEKNPLPVTKTAPGQVVTTYFF